MRNISKVLVCMIAVINAAVNNTIPRNGKYFFQQVNANGA